MLLRHSLGLERRPLPWNGGRARPQRGLRTADLGGSATTAEMTEAVLKEL